MPTSLPAAVDLLAVVREFLETEVMRDPGLGEDKRFNTRIAVNILAIVERELRLGPAASAAEADSLAALVAVEGTIEAKNRLLAGAIRNGTIDISDPRLLAHIRQTIIDALRINNPKWLNNA